MKFDFERIGENRGMLGEIFKLDLLSSEREGENFSIVAKFSALREEILSIAKQGGSHERELRCYDELLASTPINVPKMFGAWYDPETAEFLLLQELIEPDHSVDQINGISQLQARLVITEMAKLHSFWWRNPTLETLQWLPQLDDDRRRNNLVRLTTQGWDQLHALLAEERSITIKQDSAQLALEVSDMLTRTSDFPATLVHSDLRADNLLFSLDGTSVSLIDWQGCCIAPPAFDLAYFLTQSLTINDRQKYEKELLSFYMEELKEYGLEISFEKILEVYTSSLIYSLSISCAIPLINDISKPRVRDLAVAMGSRSIQALKDHGQI